MTTEKKARLEFTTEELEYIYYALNSYGLDYLRKSETWCNTENFIANGGRQDYWGREGEKINRLQDRIYKAKKRLNK